jgi:hypothetical protein
VGKPQQLRKGFEGTDIPKMKKSMTKQDIQTIVDLCKGME